MQNILHKMSGNILKYIYLLNIYFRKLSKIFFCIIAECHITSHHVGAQDLSILLKKFDGI